MIIYIVVIFLTVTTLPYIYNNLIEIVNKTMQIDTNQISQDILKKFEFLMINEYVIEGINGFKQSMVSKIPTYLNATANALISSTQSIISIIFSLVFAPIISFYFLSDLYFKNLSNCFLN